MDLQSHGTESDNAWKTSGTAPFDRAVILNAGIKVSGDRHEYLIPFNQLLAIHCKRGLVWGELEFVLPDEKVVRLHGTE